jgi:penicillin-binding protein 2
VMAAAALEEEIVTPETRLWCPGLLWLYDTPFHCNRAGGHGWVKVRDALSQSCNVYFYRLGVKLGIERIARYARRFGLGDVTRVDLPHEVSGLVPSPQWKLRSRSAPWYEGETVSVAIGQGQVSVTPLQAARLAAVVATGGKLPRPYLVDSIGDARVAREPPRTTGLRPETLEAIMAGLCEGVDRGTGWRARLPGVEVCGKTGSAQVVGRGRLVRDEDDPSLLPHAWFVAFAPAARPRVAIAVVVEHGGNGGEVAAPVARRILAHYFRLAGSAKPPPDARPEPPAAQAGASTPF